MKKLKRKILAYLISRLLGKNKKYILIHIEDKELDNFINGKDYCVNVNKYDMPNFAAKEIIINLGKQFNVNELMLDRITYEAEHNINC